ncbi:ATP-binding protein [Telmatocola sphagniphila]|uniref:ATP-binding protein n=1 Tax=Telmatocola sphagniphila TaxID=1123043 RepID=A0A8E6EUB5_9BACT|nr:ATP-binding protein [Telmatocola sphagniphila]
MELEPLTVLIGRSGTGKSNFVKAIRALRQTLQSRNLSFISDVANRPGRNFQNKQNGTQPLEQSIDVSYTIPRLKGEQNYYLVLKSEGSGISILSEALQQNGDFIFENSNKPRLELGNHTELRASTFAFKYLTQQIGCYDFPGNVLEQTNVPSRQIPEAGFVDRGVNYQDTARTIYENSSEPYAWDSIKGTMRLINPNSTSLKIDQSEKRSLLVVGYRDHENEIFQDVAQESEGYRRYLAHLLAVYQNPSKDVLIFEHPEMGIHPSALQGLANEFQNHVGRGRGQIIITTHSPQLLDYFEPEQIRVVEIVNQETRIGKLAPEQFESLKEKLLIPGELLTVDAARVADLATNSP